MHQPVPKAAVAKQQRAHDDSAAVAQARAMCLRALPVVQSDDMRLKQAWCWAHPRMQPGNKDNHLEFSHNLAARA